MEPAQQRLTYRIDAQDRIVAIDGPWDSMAAANSAPELRSATVICQPLWRYVAGDDFRHVLEMLFHRVRGTGEGVEVPFRCDSPAERRFMELSVRPLPEGALEISTALVRAEPRAYMPLLERSSRLLFGTLRICSWCKRICLFNREWVEVEEAARRMKFFQAADLPNLSHGICSDCAARDFGYTGTLPGHELGTESPG
jgi:hypothetical protein